MDMIKKKANECENRSIGIIHSEKQKWTEPQEPTGHYQYMSDGGTKLRSKRLRKKIV
jgi:hypothetical protein